MAAVANDAISVASGVRLVRLGAGGGFSPPSFSAAGAYRTTQPWLFADVQAGTPMALDALTNTWATPARESVADPKKNYIWAINGTSHLYVDHRGQWAWLNPGGDWINASGTPQATTNPHVSFTANSVTIGSSAYTADITAGVQASRSGSRWNAYILKLTGGARGIASQNNTALPAPVINVTYSDSTTAALKCVACVRLDGSTAYALTGRPEATFGSGVAIEFERPTKDVASAQLVVTVTQHTATAATIRGYIADPPVTTPTVVPGIAAGYTQDSGIAAQASVWVAHRYQDGSTLADWFVNPTSAIGVFTRSNWDPEVLGLGAADATKLPTAFGGQALAGKWINKQYFPGNVALVNSSFIADGFVPLAPGLGALRVVTPKSTAADGAVVPASTGCDLWMAFPKAVCGTNDLADSYVRFYTRFNVVNKNVSDMKMFRSGAGTVAAHAEQKGKWGIGVHHWTSRGGNNRTGGGGLGWSNRLGYEQTPADMPLLFLSPSIHSLDNLNPQVNMQWGTGGGMGADLRPDRWYCVEVRCKLNTYNAAGGSPSDGLMEVWLDGVKVMTRTGWKYRDGPLDPAGIGNDLPPFRQLGPIGLGLNEYMGGVLPSDEDRVCFYTGLVFATSYIGPMNLG